MTDNVIQQQINTTLWRQYEWFRSAVDSGEYQDYFLVMLFLKYISAVRRDRYQLLRKQYGDDEERIYRRLQREALVLPCVEIQNSYIGARRDKVLADYFSLYDRREAFDLGELIDNVFEQIELANKDKLANVFGNINFTSEARLGNSTKRNRILRKLMESLSDEYLDLRPFLPGGAEVMGNAYDYLLGKFAATAANDSRESFTPPSVSLLMAKLVAPKFGERICDPACGTGSLLLQCAREADLGSCLLYGQEAMLSRWVLCKLHMIIHGIHNSRIEWGDTLLEPKLVEKNKLMKFEIVIANPLISRHQWGSDHTAEETRRFNRWHRGVPPKSKGDLAFIIHMIETTTEQVGRMAVAVPHGVLFRGGVEGKIRQQLIEENLLDTVIGLPANVFYGTSIPAVILLFRRDRGERTNVLFVDASREYVSIKHQNVIRDHVEVEKIVKTVKNRQSVNRYAHLATYDEIAANDFNLNISSYVDTYERDPATDLYQVQGNIKELEQQLAMIREELAMTLRNFGDFFNV